MSAPMNDPNPIGAYPAIPAPRRKQRGFLVWGVVTATLVAGLWIGIRRNNTNRAIEIMNRGVESARAGDSDTAIQLYNQAIELDPRLARAYGNRAGMHLSQGHFDEAQNDCSRALELDPRDPISLVNQAALHNRFGRYEKACQTASKVIESDPMNGEAWSVRAAAQLSLGRPQDALKDVAEALHRLGHTKASASVYMTRGLAEMHLHKPSLAAVSFAEGARVDPQQVLFHSMLALAQIELGQFEDAEKECTNAIQMAARNPTGWYSRANLRARMKRFPEAIDDYTRILELDPGNTEARLMRAKCRFEFGLFAEGFSDCDAILNGTSPSATAYWYRAFGKQKSGDLRGAAEDFNEAIKREPRNPVLLMNRAAIWQLLEEFGKAAEDLDELLVLNPLDVATLSLRAWLRATASDRRFRDGKQAIADATKACELTEWRVCRCVDVLAASYAEGGDFENAVKWETRAMELATEAEKVELRNCLELYKSGRPYREGARRPGETFEPVSKEQILFKIPKSFEFDIVLNLAGSEPRRRFWARMDDTSFIERNSGSFGARLEILGRRTVDGTEGTIVEKVGFTRFQAFLPDRNSDDKRIKYRFVEFPDHWRELGIMENVNVSAEDDNSRN